MPFIEKDWNKSLGIAESLQAQIEVENLKKLSEDEYIQLETASYSTAEAKELCRISLDFLAATSMPAVYQFEFPPVLLAAWQLFTQSVQDVRKFPQLALGIPRGHAKTTLLKLAILYCILFTKSRFILVIGATDLHATNIIADIESMLNEVNIVNLFGDWKFDIQMKRADLKKFTFLGRNIILAGLGKGGSLRGLNLNNERPDVMAFDDIQTKEDSESSTISDGILRWMIGTAMKAKSPRGCLFLFSGNMYPGPHSILKKLKLNKTWIKFISGAILADGTALWPELRSLESLIDELNNDMEMGHPEIFFSEVLNDTDAGVNSKTDFAKIREWPWKEFEKPQGKFIIIDPSANKKGGDNVSIGLFEVYDSVPGLRKLIDENLSPGNTIRRALLMALTNGVRVIAVEATAYQYSLLYWFEQIANELHITGMHFVDVYTGSFSKNARITNMLKSLTSSEIDVHPDVRNQVIHQIANWNPLKRDNDDGILDLLTYAPRVLELYGAGIATELEMELQLQSADGVEEYNSAF